MFVLDPAKDNQDAVGSGREHSLNRLNPAMMDVEYSGEPIQCEPQTCQHLADMYDFRRWQGQKEAAFYKYVVDVGDRVLFIHSGH